MFVPVRVKRTCVRTSESVFEPPPTADSTSDVPIENVQVHVFVVPMRDRMIVPLDVLAAGGVPLINPDVLLTVPTPVRIEDDELT